MLIVKAFSKITLSALGITSLLFLTRCYPIEESPTAPVMPGEAIVTVGEDEYTASATYRTNHTDDHHGLIEIEILLQLEDAGQMRILLDGRTMGKYYRSKRSDQWKDLFAIYNVYPSYPPFPEYILQSGRFEITELTNGSISGAFDFWMLFASDQIPEDPHTFEPMYGEFYAVQEQ